MVEPRPPVFLVWDALCPSSVLVFFTLTEIRLPLLDWRIPKAVQREGR